MKTFSIESMNRIQYIKKINDEFTLCKGYVMGANKNRNYSFIGKDVVEANLGTLDYCPVVGYLYKNSNGEYRIAGHECHFDEDWELIPDTQAFGVVKPNSYSWETIEEYGTDVEYLTCEIILWTGRFKGLFEARYDDEIYFAQSMEINVNEYRPLEEDSNYIEILDFSFSALCLLGKYDNPDENVTPCFINARVEPKFSISDFASQIEEIKNKLFALEDTEEGETMDDKEVTIAEEEETIPETTDEAENELVSTEGEDADEIEETDEPEVIIEIQESEDFEAKYNDALTEIESLKQQIAELTPYKIEAEKIAREKAESDVFAKYDVRIGSMTEYAELKKNSANYSIEELDRECLVLVGKFVMSDENEQSEETTITFALTDDTTSNPETSRYGDVYETYKSR